MTGVWNKYEPTAARKQDKPGRNIRPKTTTIDIHSHVAVPQAGAFVQQHYATYPNPGLHDFQSPETAAVNAKQDVDMKTRLTDFDERLRDLDAMGIDMQVIKPPPGQCYYTLPVEGAVKAAQIVNDGLAEYIGRKPDRFIGLGTVPLNDGAEAAKELERAVRTLGFKGVQILTNLNGGEISDPSTAPFWKAAEELGVLVVLHPNGFTQGERLKRFYFNNVIGNPLETSIAVHNLIFDGVLERHPNLKILAVHGGGYLGAYWGRIDHVWGARSDAHSVPKPPTEYLKKIYFDTVVFSQKQLATLVETFGADRIVMGSDYPFDMADYDPVGHVAGMSDFDAATISAICGGNTRETFGIELMSGPAAIPALDLADSKIFREAMSRLGAAVHIVTTDGKAGKSGFTATAVASVSDAPSTLLVCLNRKSQIMPLMQENGCFCVNTLAANEEPTADVFAGRTGVYMADRFNTGAWTTIKTGSPALESAIAAFDCQVLEAKEVGSHVVYFGSVVAVRLGPAAKALVYHDRAYKHV